MTTKNSNNSINFLPLLIVISVTVVCLAPFAAKPFNIDEPLFIWVAKQIQLHPLDFYGFSINWYGTEMDASRIIKNPPLASYYLALAASLTGWEEIPLHLAFLLPAIAAALGTYFLAREFTQNPLPATLIGIVNPVFVMSGTTVMCDSLMLAFYVWAVYFWVHGIKHDIDRDLFIAAVLTAFCSLSKYFGVSLIPLLFVYTLANGGGKRHRLLLLLIPIIILCMYQWATYVLYDRGLLSDAAVYATDTRNITLTTLFSDFVTGLSFTGGCLISAVFLFSLPRDKRSLLASVIFVLLGTLAVSQINFSQLPEAPSWPYYLQLSIYVVAGASILILAGRSLWRQRDPDAILLVLWLTGTFVFATLVNWTVNGRSILPMAPAAGLLVMRSLEDRHGEAWRLGFKQLAVPLSCAWLIAMTVTWADFRLAETTRTAATITGRTYGGSGKTLWFQGHWGFQYYMEKNGGTAYDVKRSSCNPGDVMVIPENNTNGFAEIIEKGTPLQLLRFTPSSFLATMNFKAGVGYYSSSFGPLPFGVGKIQDERYHIIVFPPSHGL